mgnify:FL=1
MRTGKKTCEVASHFSGLLHTLQDFQFIIIEQISSTQNIEMKLLNRESYWTSQLRSVQPLGLNKRREYQSVHRVHCRK